MLSCFVHKDYYLTLTEIQREILLMAAHYVIFFSSEALVFRLTVGTRIFPTALIPSMWPVLDEFRSASSEKKNR